MVLSCHPPTIALSQRDWIPNASLAHGERVGERDHAAVRVVEHADALFGARIGVVEPGVGAGLGDGNLRAGDGAAGGVGDRAADSAAKLLRRHCRRKHQSEYIQVT